MGTSRICVRAGCCNGSASTTDPNVAYRYSTTADGGEYTEGMRLNRVQYPNRRRVHYTCGTSGGLNDKLSRVAAIADDDGSGEPGTAVAAYQYDGAGRIVVEDYEQPDVRLDLVDLAAWSATPGTYAGLDRFPMGRVPTGQVGRVKQQRYP